MTEAGESLEARLKAAMDDKQVSIESLADSTKVPASAIRYLLGEHEFNIVPPRPYLRGHLHALLRELDVEAEPVLTSFDDEFPKELVRTADIPDPKISPTALAVVAGIACLVILAVVLTLVS